MDKKLKKSALKTLFLYVYLTKGALYSNRRQRKVKKRAYLLRFLDQCLLVLSFASSGNEAY